MHCEAEMIARSEINLFAASARLSTKGHIEVKRERKPGVHPGFPNIGECILTV